MILHVLLNLLYVEARFVAHPILWLPLPTEAKAVTEAAGIIKVYPLVTARLLHTSATTVFERSMSELFEVGHPFGGRITIVGFVRGGVYDVVRKVIPVIDARQDVRSYELLVNLA